MPATPFRVRVVYGTTKLKGEPLAWEFDINQNLAAPFRASGLSYSTRFDFRKAVVLSYDTLFFERAPNPAGQARSATPVMGNLHPSLVKAVRRAAEAAAEL